MSPVEKLSNLLFAATCVREIVDDDGVRSVGELNVLARIHLGGIVNLSRGGMRPRSVARWFGAGKSLARL
jgi:hypothetical protein